MKSNISEIQRIVQAIEVTNQRAVLLYGKLFGGEFSNPYVQQPSNKMLFQNLQNLVYTVFYSKNTKWEQYTNVAAFNDIPGPVEIEQFMNDLSLENASKELFDDGWLIEYTDAQGLITARKGNYIRPVFHGEFLNSSSFHHHPAANQQIRLFCRREHKDVSTGFYYVFGNVQAEDNSDQLVRIYFNIKVSGIKQLVRSVSELFNTYLVPFSFKCANHPYLFTRSDAAVLYFDKRYSSIAFTLLQKIYNQISPHLLPETPLFTKELAKGIAFAENPVKADESFGTHISKMIAQGIMNAISKNLPKPHWLQEIKNNIEQQHYYSNIETLYLNPGSKYAFTNSPTSVNNSMINKAEKYKQAAATLAYAICRDAIWLNDKCNWIGATNEEYYGMPKAYAKSLGTNFYDGTAGVAFFLTALHRVQQDDVIEKTAHGALQHVITNELTVKNGEEFLYGKLGFHTGWTGCAYVLQSAGEVFNNSRYTDAARQLVQQCMDLPQHHWNVDIINGTAGAIPALITLYHKHKDDKLKEFVIELGRYLISKANKSNTGISWDTMPEKTNDLTGYGHGAAGIAHAFTELYTLNPDKQYLKIVKDVAGYENAHFNKEQQNWPDFRSFTAVYQSPQALMQQVCGLAWCHGAPGIGLSRLRAYELTQDNALKQDAEVAIQTTLKANSGIFIGNYSLCHGLFGNAGLFLKAAEVFHQPEYTNYAMQVADECISSYIDKRLVIPNGLQTLSETPDFMLGTSGMGYFFLRLSDPEKFPCMLLITR